MSEKQKYQDIFIKSLSLLPCFNKVYACWATSGISLMAIPVPITGRKDAGIYG